MTERQSLILDLEKKRHSSLLIKIPPPGESRNSITNPVVHRNSKKLNRRSTWFGEAFDAIGNDGVMDKIIFIKATHDIEVNENSVNDTY